LLGVFLDNFVKGDTAYDQVFMGLCNSFEEGMEEGAILILDLHPVLYKTEIEHKTVLRIACALKKQRLALKLLDLCPPDVSAIKYINRPYDGRTALFFAVEFNLAEVEDRLRSKGATTDLIVACTRGDDPMARRIVEMKYDCTTGPGNGDTPLMLMIRNFVPTAAIPVSFAVRAILIHIYTTLSHEPMLRAINATVLSGPNKGQTALWLSCSKGKEWSDISCRLIEQGANVNAKCRGMTPLMLCCTTLDFATMTSLFRKSADISQTNKDGSNAKHLLIAAMTAKTKDPEFKSLKSEYQKALLQFSAHEGKAGEEVAEGAKAGGAKAGGGAGVGPGKINGAAAAAAAAAAATTASLVANANAAEEKKKVEAAARAEREAVARAKRDADRVARLEAEAKAAATKAAANKAAKNQAEAEAKAAANKAEAEAKAAANQAAANQAAANRAAANQAAKNRAAANQAAANQAAANQAAKNRAAANQAEADAKAAEDKAVVQERVDIVEAMRSVEGSMDIPPQILINGSTALRHYGEEQRLPTAPYLSSRSDVDAFRLTSSDEMCKLVPALVRRLEAHLNTKTPEQLGSLVPAPTGPSRRGIEISFRHKLFDRYPYIKEVLDRLIAGIGGIAGIGDIAGIGELVETPTEEKDSRIWRREWACPFNVILLFEHSGRLILKVRGDTPNGTQTVWSENQQIRVPSFPSLVDLTFWYLDGADLRTKQLTYSRAFPSTSSYASLPLLLCQQRDLEQFIKDPKGAPGHIVIAVREKVERRTPLVNELFKRLPPDVKALILTLTTPLPTGGAGKRSRRKNRKRTNQTRKRRN